MKFNRLFGILFITVFCSAFYSHRFFGSPDRSVAAAPTPNIAQNISDDAPTPAAVKKTAEAITMRITSVNNGGSGVLIAKKGTTYLVLTNKHVAGRDTQFQVQTPDGQKHAAKLVSNTQINPKYDLALLQFTSTKQYQLAPLKYTGADEGSVSPLNTARNIYSAGFPFDSNKLRFSQGQVSQLSDVPLDDGTQIGYTTNKGQQELRQGMSGGPIIDAGGLVVGINTVGSYPILPNYTYFDGSKPIAKLAAQYRQANWGVPIYNFLTQVNADILYGYENLPKVQRQVTPTGYMAKLNRETRQQTVRIEDSAGNGSGVIVAKQGNTYYVLTAKHVLETPPTDKQPKQRHTGVQVITHDQESYNIEPSNIKLAEGVDLAIVKFTSQTNYSVATLGNYSPTQNATVFAGGFPARDKIDSPLWQWQLNPGRIEEKELGKLQTQDKQSFSNGYDLIYSSISYGGMSGGPVFDTQGRVIGIHGRAEGTDGSLLGKSLGISIQTFIGSIGSLQVPTISKISTSSAGQLNRADLATVIAVRDNVVKPQNTSNGEQWLQYGNQLYRIGKNSDAAVAFDLAIAQGQKYKLLGNYGKALALLGRDNDRALAAISTAIASVPASEKGKYYYLWKYQSAIFSSASKYDDAQKSIEIAIRLEPNDSTLLNQKAMIFLKKKMYREAIAIYDILIRQQAEANFYSNRGLIKTEVGQYQEAIIDLDRAIAINPNYASAYSNRGNIKTSTGQERSAIIDCDRAIALDPNMYQAYFNRALAKSKLGDEKAAIIDLDIAISINPNYEQAYFNRGNGKLRLGDKKAAISDYNRAIELVPSYTEAYVNRGSVRAELGQYKSAISDYDRAIIINPKLTQAYYNRGTTKFEIGNTKGAISDFDRAIEIDPQFALAYSNRSIAKSKLGDRTGATSDYNRAIAINPRLADARPRQGEKKPATNVNNDSLIVTKIQSAIKKYESGDIKGAIADYDRALEIAPNFAAGYNDRGILKYELGDMQGAISDYNRAIAIDSNNASIYVNRGLAKSDIGDKQAAINDYSRAIEINPKYDNAYYNRGLIKSALGQYQSAIADYDRTISINPRFAEAYLNRGGTKLILGNAEAAIADLDRAIALKPNYAKAYNNRGSAKFKLGQKKAAIADYDRAIKIDPTYANAYNSRGIIKSDLGNKQEAIEDLTKAANLFRQQNRMDLYKQAIGLIEKIEG